MKNEKQNENYNKMKVINQLAIIISFVVCIIVIKLIGLIPDELDVDYILENYAVNIKRFTAEKTETLMYLSSIMLFPIVYLIFYGLLQYILRKDNDEYSYKIINIVNNYIALIAGGIIIYLSIIRQPEYFSDGRIYTNWKLCIPFVILSIIAVFVSKKIENKKKINILVCSIVYLLLAMVLLAVAYMYVDGAVDNNDYQMHHFNAYYHPVLKITSGLTPGVDFDSIYGYYSYFFALLMQGNMYSILLFNIIIAVLIIISFVCIIKFLTSFVKNKVILVYSFLFIMYCSVLQQIMSASSTYLQYVPHRILFPTILLAYIVLYLKSTNIIRKNILKIIGFFISSIAIFWNLDTGIVVLGTWVIVLGYEILITNSLKDKKTYLEITKIIVMAICSVLTYVLLLNVIGFFRTGNIVGIKNILYGQSNFIGSGYNMIKMELWHPWLILTIIYMIGLAIPLSALCKKDSKVEIDANRLNRNMAILGLTILGCGIFTYYQGRSHNSVFYSVLYPAIMLMAIYVDDLINSTKNTDKSLKPVKYTCIFFITFIFSMFAITSIYNLGFNKNIRRLYNKERLRGSYDFSEMDEINETINDIEFLLDYESYYYTRYKRADTKKISSYVDLFTYEDYKGAIDIIKKTKSICTAVDVYEILNTRYLETFEEEIKDNYYIYLKEKVNLCVFLNKQEYQIEEYNKQLAKLEFERVN